MTQFSLLFLFRISEKKIDTICWLLWSISILCSLGLNGKTRKPFLRIHHHQFLQQTQVWLAFFLLPSWDAFLTYDKSGFGVRGVYKGQVAFQSTNLRCIWCGEEGGLDNLVGVLWPKHWKQTSNTKKSEWAILNSLMGREIHQVDSARNATGRDIPSHVDVPFHLDVVFVTYLRAEKLWAHHVFAHVSFVVGSFQIFST